MQIEIKDLKKYVGKELWVSSYIWRRWQNSKPERHNIPQKVFVEEVSIKRYNGATLTIVLSKIKNDKVLKTNISIGDDYEGVSIFDNEIECIKSYLSAGEIALKNVGNSVQEGKNLVESVEDNLDVYKNHPDILYYKDARETKKLEAIMKTFSLEAYYGCFETEKGANQFLYDIIQDVYELETTTLDEIHYYIDGLRTIPILSNIHDLLKERFGFIPEKYKEEDFKNVNYGDIVSFCNTYVEE